MVGRPAEALSYELVTSEVMTVPLVHFDGLDMYMIDSIWVLKKLGPKIREVREEQPFNMLLMPAVTAEVSNDERSREVKLVQLPNM